MLHIEKGAAQEAAVRFAEPEADPQTGFPIGRDHTDKSRSPHPEQGAGASGSKCSSNNVYSHLGYNLKATDMQAAIGCAQLDKFPSFVERRRHNFDRLKAALAGTEDKLILPEACEHARPSWFGFLITCKEGTDRNQVVQHIEKMGVQTRMLFAGNLVKHPCFDEMRKNGEGFRVVGSLEHTDRILKDTFWVGVYPGMTDEMIDYMAKTIREAIA